MLPVRRWGSAADTEGDAAGNPQAAAPAAAAAPATGDPGNAPATSAAVGALNVLCEFKLCRSAAAVSSVHCNSGSNK